MYKTPPLITLLSLLVFTSCAGDHRTPAETARDSRLAILKPAILRQGVVASDAAVTSADSDNSVPPGAPETIKCKEHERHGDKACTRAHDDDRSNDEGKHDKGGH